MTTRLTTQQAHDHLPYCRTCGATLRPTHRRMSYDEYQHHIANGGSPYVRFVTDPDHRGYHGQNLFCSLRCGYRFAVDIIRHPERI